MTGIERGRPLNERARNLAGLSAGSLLLLSMLYAAPGCRGQGHDTGGDDPPRSYTGMFNIDTDGQAQFTACHTRTMVPVARSGEWTTLKNAYEEWRKIPGEQLLITVTGRIGVPEAVEDSAEALETPHLVIDRFEGIWPGETCGRPGAVAQLQDMYWKLTRLDGRPVIVHENAREPHLVFHSSELRLAGSGGCNRLRGRYELSGASLACRDIATTRVACPGMMDQERDFLEALDRVVAWRLEGQHLELLDGDGAALLRFEERALTH